MCCNSPSKAQRMEAVLYIHGKGGSASESGHYKPLFPGYDVLGLDYKTFTPWETGAEIRAAVQDVYSLLMPFSYRFFRYDTKNYRRSIQHLQGY